MNKSNKARIIDSPILDEILKEISPLEMGRTKNRMQISARIDDLIKSTGKSKTNFAKKHKKKPSEISRWVSGTQNFTIDELTEISFLLGVELSDIIQFKP